MKRLILIAALAATTGCSFRGSAPEPSPATPTEIAGHYGQSGHIGFLDLYANGEYECFVVNGMSLDGCMTFEGAGVSRGSWVLKDGALAFVPMSEPARDAIEAQAILTVPVRSGLSYHTWFPE